jgi:hypothetical protein
MFYNNNIENVYIINGLARSGNHLFISWLISSFKNHEVYYLNNVKPTIHGIINNSLDLDTIFKYHTVTSNNRYGNKLDNEIKNKLVNNNNMKKFLYNRKKIKVLIISMENKKIDKLDLLSTYFTNAKNIYKCIIIRDIVNLFSSRIESEKNMKYQRARETYYLTDEITIDYWLDNYSYINNKNYIIFNYNKFLCYVVTRKTLAKKLNIEYDKTKISLNKFGVTAGSSFKKNNNINNKSSYFMRWLKNKDNKLIINLLDNSKIMKILCKDFSMCLNFNTKEIKICKITYPLEI